MVKRKSSFFIIILGLIIVIIGFSLMSLKFVREEYIEIKEDQALKEFYVKEELSVEEDEQAIKEVIIKEEKNKINYIAVLQIPKIKLTRGLVDKNDKKNDIKYNVTFLQDSDMPDEKNGNVILAAHSGTAYNSYFKDLDKLEIEDEITISYKKKDYIYSVSNIYEIEKTGSAKIFRNNNSSTLTLVTCKHNTNKQIIIICDLIN